MTQISGNSGDRIICGEIKNKGSDNKQKCEPLKLFHLLCFR